MNMRRAHSAVTTLLNVGDDRIGQILQSPTRYTIRKTLLCQYLFLRTSGDTGSAGFRRSDRDAEW